MYAMEGQYMGCERFLRYDMLDEVQASGKQFGVKDDVVHIHGRVLMKVAKKNSDEHRYVPALVMDVVEGTCMKKMLPDAFNDQGRDRIMKAVVKIGAKMLTVGILDPVLHPKDIILRNEFSEHLRVTVFDFSLRQCHWGDNSPELIKARNTLASRLFSPTMLSAIHHMDLHRFMTDGWFVDDDEKAVQSWLDKNFRENDAEYVHLDLDEMLIYSRCKALEE
jgi:hypothetical protein